MANRKDADTAAEMLHKKLTGLGAPFITVGVTVGGLIVYTDKPLVVKTVAPKTCGGWKVKLVKTSPPRPAEV